jgi:uncharacterized protein YcbX
VSDNDEIRVESLWHYPVKSMAGVSLDSLTLEGARVKGDRLYAIRDERGKLGSGKETRRFTFIHGLLGYKAGYTGGKLVITSPEGEILEPEQAASELSLKQGRQLQLVREAEVSHLDAAPVHILTTASLRWLAKRCPNVQIDLARFRPNIVLDCPGEEQTEQDWMDRVLSIGAVKLRVMEPTVRCVMVGMAQDDLEASPNVLKTLTRESACCFGVYAEIVETGVVEVGSPVQITSGK